MTKKQTLFFTVANKRYEPFVLPYIFSVIAHNWDAEVEIVLEEPRRFEIENADALEYLAENYGKRFMLTRGDFTRASPNALRFMMRPRRLSTGLEQLRPDHVYIGDIDILILENVTKPHLEHMKKTGLPFSNIRRKGKDRLSGLHFTRVNAFYPLPEHFDQLPIHADEELLFKIVEGHKLGTPHPSETFRPLHGYHMSLSRPPVSSTHMWGGIQDDQLLKTYMEFRKTRYWRDMYRWFDKRYKMMLSIIDSAIFSYHVLSDEEFKVNSPKDWWDT